MKYKTSGSENSLKNPVNGGSVPVDAAGTGGIHQGSGPHVNSQDLLPTLQFPLVSATYPGLQDKGAWMDKEDLSVERLEQQDRAPLLPTTLLDLPAVASAPSTVAHMDPIRAELIFLGSLTPPCPGEQPEKVGHGGTWGAQGSGTSHHTGCCLHVTFGVRGAALAVLILPAESKERPFPTANQTCGIWKSPRHNKQGILGCFKCVPAWIYA